MTKIKLSSPHSAGKELTYVREALEKNEISCYGENLSKFEKSLQDYIGGNKEVVSTVSGTSAIHLALILAGVTREDEVICQSMTFSASVFPIIYQGATPIFVDSESNTWNMCPIALETAIKDRIKKGKKPKAIIIVHIYGMPADMSSLIEVAEKYEILIIEDAAEAIGSSYKGQKCGTFGYYSIFSFNGNKIITSSGGGALICQNIKDKERAIFLATQARDDVPYYEHSEIGYNYKMSNIIAAIGRAQVEVLDERIQMRRKNNFFYQELFEGLEGCYVHVEPSDSFFSNHWLSCILVDSHLSSFDNKRIISELHKEGIESRFLWKPMHLQPVFKEYPYYGSSISERLFEKGLCLPSGSSMLDQDKEKIATILNRLIVS